MSKKLMFVTKSFENLPSFSALTNFSESLFLSNNSNSEFCQYASNVFLNLSIIWLTSFVVIFKFHSKPSVKADREKLEEPIYPV